MTLTDTAWLALIVAVPPTITALGAIAISLYNSYVSARAAESLREVAKALVDSAAAVVERREREAERSHGRQEFP